MDESPLQPPEELRHFSQEDWNHLWVRLLYFASARYPWLLSEGGEVGPEDLVQEAIKDTFQGKRIMPRGINVVTFFCQVIRSKASHLAAKRGRAVPLEEENLARYLSSFNLQSYQQTEDAFQQIAYEQLLNKIRELTRDDEIVSQIVDQWLVDPSQGLEEIAFILNLSAEQMRNARRRLKRKLKDLREEWF